MFLKYPSVIGTTPVAALAPLSRLCVCTHVQKSLSKTRLALVIFMLKYNT